MLYLATLFLGLLFSTEAEFFGQVIESLNLVYVIYMIAAGLFFLMLTLYMFLPKTVKFMKSRENLKNALEKQALFPMHFLYFIYMFQHISEVNFQNYMIGWIFLLIITRGVSIFKYTD